MKKLFGFILFSALALNSTVPLFANNLTPNELSASEREEIIKEIKEVAAKYDDVEVTPLTEEEIANMSDEERENMISFDTVEEYEEALKSSEDETEDLEGFDIYIDEDDEAVETTTIETTTIEDSSYNGENIFLSPLNALLDTIKTIFFL